MTEKSSPIETEVEGSDQKSYPFQYGHGRMPTFMKIVWIGFLIGATYYTVAYLLTSLQTELGM